MTASRGRLSSFPQFNHCTAFSRTETAAACHRHCEPSTDQELISIHRGPLRLDDLEHPWKLVHQHHQFAEPQRLARNRDLAGADGFRERRQFCNYLIERTAREHKTRMRVG